jgi:hypothetical protein
MQPGSGGAPLQQSSLLDALRQRRSRRFGVGMHMASGPMAFRSARGDLLKISDVNA